MDSRQVCLIVIGLIFLALVTWYFVEREEKKKHHPSKKEETGGKEGYSNIGDMDNVGSLDTGYELVQAPDDAVPAEHFADIVDNGDQQKIVQQAEQKIDEKDIALERLDRINNRSLLPRVSTSATPYAVDVANISSWAFAVNAPRVQLKNRVNMQADPYRGDIPIRYDPNVPVISRSSYGREAQKLDGFFSAHYRDLYAKYSSRAYKNMPIKVANGATIMDF